MEIRTRAGGTAEVPVLAPAGNYGLRKRIDSAVLNTTVAHTITFDFRWDSELTGFTTFEDRINITASASQISGTGTNTT